MAKDSPSCSIFGDRGAWLQKTRGFFFRGRSGGAVDCRIQFDLHHPKWLPAGSGQSVGNNFSGDQFRTIGPSVDLNYPV